MAYMERKTRPSANHIITDAYERATMEMHRKRLADIKPSIDTGRGKPRQYKHLHKNAKREYLLEERYATIERDNLHLLSKMHDILNSRYKRS
jgi:hypothetical protein